MKNSLITLLAIIAILPFLSGCNKDREGVFSGTYSYGFENSTFIDNKENEIWWLHANSETLAPIATDYSQRLDSLGSERVIDQLYKITVQGIVSHQSGGHLGGYATQLIVEELIDFEWIESESIAEFERSKIRQKKQQRPEPHIDELTGHKVAVRPESEIFHVRDGRIIHIGEDSETNETWFYTYEDAWFTPSDEDLKLIKEMREQ